MKDVRIIWINSRESKGRDGHTRDCLTASWVHALYIEGKSEEGRCGAKCGCGSTGSNPNGHELDELGTREIRKELPKMLPCRATFYHLIDR